MMRNVESVWLGAFLAGLLGLGLFGTWAETTPFWYGAALLSVAGVGAVISRQGRPAERVGWGCVFVMLGFAAYVFWRGLTSEVRWLARQDLVFAATALVAYGLVAVRFTGLRARLAILAVLCLLVAGNAGLGLYQYFGDPRMSVFRGFGLRRGPEISAGGFFESGNHLAGFMTLAGLPLLGVALLGRGLGTGLRAGAGLGFLMAGIGVAFSTSRGGALGFFTGTATLMAIAGILGLRSRKLRQGNPGQGAGWWLPGLAGLFVALLAVAGMTLKKTFGEGPTLRSLNGRGPLWDAALEQWQTAPFLGTGARSYEYMERGFRTLETLWMTRAGEIDAQFAHNDYLQCLADYGLTGLGLALLVAGGHTWHAMTSLLRSSGDKAGSASDTLAAGLAAGSVAALAGSMLQALGEFNLHIGINVVMTGLCLGWMATPGFRKPDPLPPLPGRPAAPEIRPRAGAGICGQRVAVSGVVAAVSLVLLETGWRLAPADLAWMKGRKQLAVAVDLQDLIATSGTLQRATSLDPDNAQAWHTRGMVTLQIASLTNPKYANPFYEAAFTQFEQSLKLYPQNPYAAAQAGSVAGHLGHMDAAEGFFRTALRWGLNIQSVNALYGDYLMRRKEYYKAIGYFVNALHLSGDPEVRTNMDQKMQHCLKRLKQQGITPPPESRVKP